MPEHQNIEYKQSWHDDYLKWIVGFANSQGGTIYIGKDDNGNVVFCTTITCKMTQFSIYVSKQDAVNAESIFQFAENA